VKVILCERPGELNQVERPAPQRSPGEVLIKVRRVGLCGTDYHILEGTQPYLSYPRVMGHEFSGEIIECDPASGFQSGQIVCVIPYLSCGHCRACRKGKTNCCREMQVLGVHRDGALAEFLSVPAQFVIPADGLSLDQAAMVEFLSIGRHAVARGSVHPGDQVLVVGAGPIGIAVTIFAIQQGASVTIMDRTPSRAEFCVRELGAKAAIAVDDSAADRAAEITGGNGFDLVFDATGNPRAMEAGFTHVGHGGSYVLVSVVTSDITFNDPEFHKRETTLLGSRNATVDDFRAVMDAIREGAVPTDKLRTHWATLEELPSLVKSWAQPESGVIKAIVELT
jgi:2-desacetyl-2-hydroxyethyl bacteriochlorophyllide A dehydrogenase